jgi:amidophosphoribosyltransferase
MCGIVGIYNQKREVAPELYFALMFLQHRGKESAGIVTFDSGRILAHIGMGEVPQVFTLGSLSGLSGRVGIAHTRYSTTGSSDIGNAQPIRGFFHGREFFVGHNGNLVNVKELLKEVDLSEKDLGEGCSDTRVIAALISFSKRSTFEEAILETLVKLKGAFNLIFLFDGKLYAIRDPFGFHPLQLGQRREDFFVASESCVFDQLGGVLVRDIRPGEMLIIDEGGVRPLFFTERTSLKIDIFEYIYFLRPDSVVEGAEAGLARYWMGRFLADEHPMDVDIITPIPDSGNEAALGYYERMREKGFHGRFLPWALFRPHTVSRTFIEPVKELRKEYLRLKFNPRPFQLRGMRVAAVDDSLVRGTTEEVLAGLFSQAGVSELHSLKASPMYLNEDIYGIDTYRVRDELIAKECGGDLERITEELRKRAGLRFPTSLSYLSLGATVRAVLQARQPGSLLNEHTFYAAQFTGEYPAGKGDFEKQATA